MKRQILLLMMALFVMCACSKKETSGGKEPGYLTLNIAQGASMKAGIEITDFILRISDGTTDLIKERIRELPEQIVLPAGSYTIEAYSMDFFGPRFDMPVYSGKTIVEIEAGEISEASLVCSQSNAGVKVVWSSDFPKMFSTYQAQIDCDEGYLNYTSNETRTGYFLPGKVSITILADGLTINGGTMVLAAKDMVTANLRTKESPSGNMSIEISVDESVNEREVDVTVDPNYRIGVPNSETNPYSIAQAIEHQGENAVWVQGYIVGSKPSSGYDFVNGAWQTTNIVLADDIDETSDTKVVFVELLSGTYRTNLNLVDNKDLIHQMILIKGNLLAYQSRSGLRNLTSYSFK